MAQVGEHGTSQSQPCATQEVGTQDARVECQQHLEVVEWAHLMSMNPEHMNQGLIEDVLLIGRSKKCGVSFPGNPAVSNMHCKIWREYKESSSKTGPFTVFIQDLSTNGTYLFTNRIEKNSKEVLCDNAEITLHAPSDRTNIISYKFVLTKKSSPKISFGTTNEYELGEKIGHGAFAIVHRAMNVKTGTWFAMKVIDTLKMYANPTRSDRAGAVMDEVDVLKRVSHPNIAGIHDVFIGTERPETTDLPVQAMRAERYRYIYIVLDFCDSGDLLKDMLDYGGYTEADAKAVFRKILSAVAYLHSQGIVHRDLKPENVLLHSPPQAGVGMVQSRRSQMGIKVADFGLSRVVGDSTTRFTTVCGTPAYIAPEVLVAQQSQHPLTSHQSAEGSDASASPGRGDVNGYSFSVDMWSLGVVLYTMLASENPFAGTSDFGLLSAARKGLTTFSPPAAWAKVSPDTKRVVQMLLNVDASLRPSAASLLESPWLSMDGEFAIPQLPTFIAAPASSSQQHGSGKRKLPPKGVVTPEASCQSIGDKKARATGSDL